MGSEWRTVRLGEVIEINPESIGSDWPYAHIRYIDISSVAEGSLVELPQWISISDAPSRAKRLVYKGDTILSTVRPNRRSMLFIKEPGPDWVVSTGFAVLRPKQEHIEPRYLYAYVFNRGFTDYLISREKGAAYPAVLPDDIADAIIALPPLPEQRAIAHILGTLDDKIELNRRMNETLEEMARALFKSWFVDFEPVRAKIDGRWRQGQSLPGLPAHLYDLFPDSFVDSELGEIPRGWREVLILDFADLLSGGTPKTEVPAYWDGDIPWVSAKDVTKAQNLFVLSTERQITKAGVENSATKVLPALTTVVSARRTVGNHCLLGREMAMNQTNYGLRAKDNQSHYFVFFNISHLVEELRQQAYGTIFDTITTRTFQHAKIVRPSDLLIHRFEAIAGSMMTKVLANLHESRTLAALRDALLPKLITGELRLKEAERFLEERGL